MNIIKMTNSASRPCAGVLPSQAAQSSSRVRALPHLESAAQSHTLTSSQVQVQPFEMGYRHLFWLFFFCSIIGLGVEAFYGFLVLGYYPNRAGLVWGPFSPIYGCGACLMVLALRPLVEKGNGAIFMVSMLVGIFFEALTALLMTTFFGVTCWDYAGMPGSINSSINIFFGVAWGFLGIFLMRVLYPGVIRFVDAIPTFANVVLTTIMSAFMVVNIFFTLCAFDRQAARADDQSPTNSIERLCDSYFPSEWMNERFFNMNFK